MYFCTVTTSDMVGPVIIFIALPSLVSNLFSEPYLHFAFRDIIERVADVMKMYCFIHVAEAFAVRTFAVQVTLSHC